MIFELLSFFSAVLASAFGGFFIAHLAQLKKVKEELSVKVVEFDDITKKASEANLSLATKLIDIDQRLDSIESWRGIMGSGVNSTSTGWK
jgi:uncharacterized protein YlxW (UPF0749 family)